MKRPVVLLCAALVAGAAMAGPYSTALRQTMTAASPGSGQETARPAMPPPQNNPPPNPVLQKTLKNISNLKEDLAALAGATGTNVLGPLKLLLTQHCAEAAQGAKASPETVSKLADDLTSAIAGNQKLISQLPRLAQFVHASFNGSQLAASQQKMILDGVQKILAGAGASSDGAAGVVDDLKAITSETK